MSRLRSDRVVNKAGTGAPELTYGAVVPATGTISGAGGINITGVATATSFSGNLTGNVTGNADTATTATNAQGLTGSPSITVTNVSAQDVQVGGALTVTGNFTVNGTTTTLDTVNVNIEDKNIGLGSVTSPSNSTADGAGITIFAGSDGDKTFTYSNTKKSFETNIPLSPDESRLNTVSEKVTRVSGNTVSLVYSSSSSNIGFATNPTGDITLNVTGIPTSSDFDDHIMSFSVVVNQTGTARTCTAVTLNGVSKTINWAGGSLSAAIAGVTTTSGTDIFTFTGINTVGSASTADNYRVLGMVNGGFA